ncbi:MAG: ankyrin repeat domain-containing protein [Acidobacteriota bacterium]|nr:ankyrin repeat domain-containing protein [Acidobacteriota bacterium]
MRGQGMRLGWGGGAAAAVMVSALMSAVPMAQSGRAVVTSAAEAGDLAQVRRLLRDGADVNAALGDGTTALHQAAMRGDADMVDVLVYAGANVKATTRLGGYTPLHLASQRGHAVVIDRLVKAGADPNQATATGTTPLMFAAASGHVDAVKQLVAHKADLNATELASDQTALMFAAAFERPEVVKLLVEVGADLARTSKVTDIAALTSPEEALQEEIRLQTQRASAQSSRPAPAPRSPENETPGLTRPYRYNELIGKQGGLGAIHYAARQGSLASVQALLDGGANVNQRAGGDDTTPLLIAVLNGHYDLAMYLLERGADPTAASDAGATPLYATVNIEWAPRSFYPQPRAQLQQRTNYLDLMRALLDKGADPNARLRKKLWYTQYNFDLLRTDEGGATAFWRAAYASDLEAMKLLLAHGADPFITTIKGPTQQRQQGGVQAGDPTRLQPMPAGSPGINALHAAAGVGYGEGFAGNAHRFAPTGMLAAVKFLVEEVHVDVNSVDDDGNTAVHHAASRGDNEMIVYLVSKGADVTRVNRAGLTTLDMANGPVQRTQPYPETIKLLESLGAKNNHRCVSC